MRKYTKSLIAILTLSVFSANAAEEFTITPKVTLESGYVTKITYLGLENQKNSSYVAGSVSLENKIVTPTIGVTYFLRGEGADQTVLDGSLSKSIGNNIIGLTLTGGVQKRIVQTADDNLLGYGTVRVDKLWAITKIATPYVSIGKDFDQDLFGVTFGLDRTISIKSVDFTPRAEVYIYDNYKSYKFGGSLVYTGIKYIRPFVDAAYVTNEDSILARRMSGEGIVSAGVRLSF